MEQPKEYYAFISYKREDKKEAKRLQHALEYYRLPNHLRQENPDLPEYVRPVFRDMTDLEVGELSLQIHEGLEQSHFLIVVSSPRAAASKWVNDEVEYFISLGKQDKIIPYIIEGVPHASNPDEECYPPALLNLSKEKELLGANINEVGKGSATIRVVSRMFNIRFDTLYQRYLREQKKRRTQLIVAIVISFLFLTGIAGWIWRQNVLLKEREWKMMENQARFVSTKALDLIESGDAYTSTILALYVLPSNMDSPERPYTPEAEYALRMSLKQQSVIMNGHRDMVNSVMFSPNGKEIVSSSNDSSVIVWDAITGNMKYELKGHKGCVNFASFNPQSNKIVSGSNDGTIRIWDALVGKELLQIKVDEWIETAVYSPDGNRIATVAQGTIQLWDSKDGTEILKIPVHLPEEMTFNGKKSLCFNIDSMQINSVFFSPDGKRLVSASNDETVRIWDANTGKELKRLVGHHDQVKSASFNPNGQTVLSISWFEGIAIIWDAQTGEILLREDKPYPIRSATFSNDGKHVIFSSDNDSVYILNANTLVEEYCYKANTDVVSYASFSPDNHFFVSSSWDKTVKLCRIEAPHTEILQINTNPRERHFDAMYSLDCKKIITSNPLIIWDAQTGGIIDSLTSYSGNTIFTNYRLDDITNSDNIPFITDNGSKKAVINLHSYKGDQINFACFSESNYGKYELKISQNDNSILVYNVEYGAIVDKKVGLTNEMSSVTFSSDGQRIMAASVDGKVLVWDFIPIQELIDMSRERFKNRKLTPEEKSKYYLE